MTDPEQLGLEIVKHYAETRKKIADYQVDEALFRARAAQVDLEKAQNEAEFSAKVATRTDRQSANFIRPSSMFKPFLTQLDDGWIATYGELIAHGATPETAYQEFDRLWAGKDEI